MTKDGVQLQLKYKSILLKAKAHIPISLANEDVMD